MELKEIAELHTFDLGFLLVITHSGRRGGLMVSGSDLRPKDRELEP